MIRTGSPDEVAADVSREFNVFNKHEWDMDEYMERLLQDAPLLEFCLDDTPAYTPQYFTNARPQEWTIGGWS